MTGQHEGINGDLTKDSDSGWLIRRTKLTAAVGGAVTAVVILCGGCQPADSSGGGSGSESTSEHVNGDGKVECDIDIAPEETMTLIAGGDGDRISATWGGETFANIDSRYVPIEGGAAQLNTQIGHGALHHNSPRLGLGQELEQTETLTVDGKEIPVVISVRVTEASPNAATMGVICYQSP